MLRLSLALIFVGLFVGSAVYGNTTFDPKRDAQQKRDTKKRMMILVANKDINGHDDEGLTPLVWAAREGETKWVQKLIEMGANADLTDEFGWTPLMQSVSVSPDPTQVVDLLVDAGADVNAVNVETESVLLIAAQRGHIEAVRHLIAAGANVNYEGIHSWGYAPLIASVKENHIEVVKLLVQSGAHLDLQDKEGLSALFWSCYLPYTKDIALYLIESGASVHLKNERGETPLIYACNFFGRGGFSEYDAELLYDIVAALLKAEADPQFRNESAQTALIVLRTNAELQNSWTAQKLKKVEALLETASDIDLNQETQ